MARSQLLEQTGGGWRGDGARRETKLSSQMGVGKGSRSPEAPPGEVHQILASSWGDFSSPSHEFFTFFFNCKTLAQTSETSGGVPHYRQMPPACSPPESSLSLLSSRATYQDAV